ncbi:MAG: G8 domain-containing protein [Bacteroidota bacterium]
MNHSFTSSLSLALVVILSIFLLAHSHAQNPALRLVPTSEATHTAVTSGDWTDAATWGGSLPTDEARVVIPEGINVRINSLLNTRIKTIRIDGTLHFARDVTTVLKVETMVSSSQGRLEIGSPDKPIAANVSANILILDDGPIDTNWDPAKISRGMILMGPVTMHGQAKSSWHVLATQAAAGTTTLSLQEVPNNWRAGDRIIVAGTDPNDHKSDESTTIESISGNNITLPNALLKDHLTPADDLDVHIANASRNINIKSENTNDIKQRGHIMFMHHNAVDIRYVEFSGLGRTNKRISLDDTEFPDLEEDGSFVPGPRNNIRGRYSIHFHRGGGDPNGPTALVQGCSVTDDPGWAYVNHSARVDFIENVSYNIVGGAFQTESGDETGSFRRNIAIRTVNPDDPMKDPGSPAALVDIRENFQDYAWQGDAFWIHGGGVAVEGNVASGASGHAFIYWPEGLIEANLGMTRGNKSWVPNNHLLNDVTVFNIWWIPILSSKNNTAYSASKGLVSYYLHTSFLDEEEERPGSNVSQAYRNTLNSTFEGYTIWNIRQSAVDFNYTERITLKDSRLVGTGRSNLVGVDANQFFNLNNLTFDNLTIEGFDIGFDVPSNGIVNISNCEMNNRIDFRIREPQISLDTVEIPGRFGRKMRIDNVRFLNPNGTPIQMMPVFTLVAEVQDGIDDEDTSKDELYFLLTDEITLNFGAFQEARLYFDQQAPDFIPITNANSSLPGTDVIIPREFVNKSNRQLQDEFDSSFGGALLPSSAMAVPEVVGGKLSGIVTSTKETNKVDQVQCIPNPVQHSFQVRGNEPSYQGRIWSLDGSLLWSGQVDPTTDIDIHELAAGFYLLQLSAPGWSQPISLKLVKL